MTLDDFPAEVPSFTTATCPKGNLWTGSTLALFHDLQRRALGLPDVDHWRMMPKGAVLAVRQPYGESALVLQIQRAGLSGKAVVAAFGLEVQAVLHELNVSRQIRTQRIDDRRHEPERRLRYLAVLAPKGDLANG